MRIHSEDRRKREWDELYQRLTLALAPYGEDSQDSGDYYLVDEDYENYVLQVEMHKLIMLRPEIIETLRATLAGYPDWEVEISVLIPETGLRIDSSAGLTLREDAIVDALDRTQLPAEYRDLVYAGSRPPRRFWD